MALRAAFDFVTIAGPERNRHSCMGHRPCKINFLMRCEAGTGFARILLAFMRGDDAQQSGRFARRLSI